MLGRETSRKVAAMWYAGMQVSIPGPVRRTPFGFRVAASDHNSPQTTGEQPPASINRLRHRRHSPIPALQPIQAIMRLQASGLRIAPSDWLHAPGGRPVEAVSYDISPEYHNSPVFRHGTPVYPHTLYAGSLADGISPRCLVPRASCYAFPRLVLPPLSRPLPPV